METYRSGHNENDSKSFWRDERHVGSNPTVSAILGKPKRYLGKKPRNHAVFCIPKGWIWKVKNVDESKRKIETNPRDRKETRAILKRGMLFEILSKMSRQATCTKSGPSVPRAGNLQ